MKTGWRLPASVLLATCLTGLAPPTLARNVWVAVQPVPSCRGQPGSTEHDAIAAGVRINSKRPAYDLLFVSAGRVVSVPEGANPVEIDTGRPDWHVERVGYEYLREDGQPISSSANYDSPRVSLSLQFTDLKADQDQNRSQPIPSTLKVYVNTCAPVGGSIATSPSTPPPAKLGEKACPPSLGDEYVLILQARNALIAQWQLDGALKLPPPKILTAGADRLAATASEAADRLQLLGDAITVTMENDLEQGLANIPDSTAALQTAGNYANLAALVKQARDKARPLLSDWFQKFKAKATIANAMSRVLPGSRDELLRSLKHNIELLDLRKLGSENLAYKLECTLPPASSAEPGGQPQELLLALHPPLDMNAPAPAEKISRVDVLTMSILSNWLTLRPGDSDFWFARSAEIQPGMFQPAMEKSLNRDTFIQTTLQAGSSSPGVRTPEATIKPNGTTYLVHRDEARQLTFVYVSQGTVVVIPTRGATLQLTAGQAVLVKPDGPRLLKPSAGSGSGTGMASSPVHLPNGDTQFDRPSVNGVSVDNCANWGTNCGQPGADLFCRSQGYRAARSFQMFTTGRTLVLGDNRLCDGGSCVGFSQVVCTTQNAAAPVPVGQPGYLGCFLDRDARAMSVQIPDNAHMTAQYCIDQCRSRGFAYAGTQYSVQCFCGNNYNPYGPANNCNMACGGDASHMCGGSWASSVFSTGIRAQNPAPAIPAPPPPPAAAHTPPPSITQLPNGDTQFDRPSVNGVSVDNCANWGTNCGQPGADLFCRSQGYKAARSFQMFQPGRTVVLGDNRLCDGGSCVGFSQVVCTTQNAAAPAPVGQPAYLGCFLDRDARAMSVQIPDNARMTAQYCIDQCRSKGFAYAGTQYSVQCFCGNNYNPYGPANNCNMACGGDAGHMCGGSWASSVFSTGIRAQNPAPAIPAPPPPPAATHTPPPSITQLPNGDKQFDRPSVNGVSVDNCANWGTNCGQPGADLFCRSQGYKAARSFQMFQPGRTVVLGDNRLCDGGSCVGFSQVVCTTQNASPSTLGQASYLGCFVDREARAMNGWTTNNGSMNVPNCVNECRGRGFPYAGLQYSSYCFCGGNDYNRYGQANNCDMHCSGNAGQICGGSWANSVYSTGR